MSESPALPNPGALYSRWQRALFLFVLFLTGTCNYIDRQIVTVLLEPIRHEFHASDKLLGLLSGFSFALLYAALGLPVARWADRGDRRLVITLSLSVWSGFTMLCGAVHSVGQLVLARIGVGAGEAGAVPPAQSLIADYFSPAARGRAMAIYVMSGTAGLLIGQVGGGWIAQLHGWRAAFVAAGLIGFALLWPARALLREPRREAGFVAPDAAQEPVGTTLRALAGKPAYRNIVAAMTLYYFVAYGALVFNVSFLVRVHGLTLGQAGELLGLVTAAATLIGSIGGGALADWLGRADRARFARLAGWLLIGTTLLFLPLYRAGDLRVTAAFIFVTATLLSAAVPAIYAAMHLVCGSARRATAVAVMFFFANLVGLGLGPLVTGALSDGFAAQQGKAESLRHALQLVIWVLVPAGVLMLRAARTLNADVEA